MVSETISLGKIILLGLIRNYGNNLLGKITLHVFGLDAAKKYSYLSWKHFNIGGSETIKGASESVGL